jgi:hypothetical protein
LLARERFGLDGNDMANQVPHYPDAASAPNPRQRARSIVEWALKRLLDELGKDIEGATFEVRFAPSGAPVGG